MVGQGDQARAAMQDVANDKTKYESTKRDRRTLKRETRKCGWASGWMVIIDVPSCVCDVASAKEEKEVTSQRSVSR